MAGQSRGLADNTVMMKLSSVSPLFSSYLPQNQSFGPPDADSKILFADYSDLFPINRTIETHVDKAGGTHSEYSFWSGAVPSMTRVTVAIDRRDDQIIKASFKADPASLLGLWSTLNFGKFEFSVDLDKGTYDIGPYPSPPIESYSGAKDVPLDRVNDEHEPTIVMARERALNHIKKHLSGLTEDTIEHRDFSDLKQIVEDLPTKFQQP